MPAQAYVANWLASFKEFPPRQKPASFSLDQVMEQIQEGATHSIGLPACWREVTAARVTCGWRASNRTSVSPE